MNESAAVAPPGPRRLDRLLRPDIIVPGVVLLVYGVLGIVQLARSWQPDGDWAIAELIIRHVDRHVPLSGPYSADRGYNHPLPLIYGLQLPAYLLFGQRSSAGLATTVWFDGAVLAGTCWLLVRARATGMAVTLVAAVSLFAAYASRGTFLLPWNPNLGVVPSLAFLIVAWRVALGSRRLLPVLVALGIWCSGAHLGFVPMVIAVTVAAVAALIVRDRRHGRVRPFASLRRPALLSAAIALVLTAPMLIDLLQNGSDSNPVQILTGGSSEAAGPGLPKGDLVSVLLDQLRIPPSWASSAVSHSTMMSPRHHPVPIGLLLIGFVVHAAWRRRANDEILAIGLAALGMLASIAGLATIDDPHLVHWYLLPTHAASLILWVFVLSSAGRSVHHAVRKRRPPAAASRSGPRIVPLAGAAGAAAFAALLLAPSLRLAPHTARIAEVSDHLVDTVEEILPSGTPVVVAGPTRFDGYVTAAFALALDRSGFDVRVPDHDLYLYSPAMGIPDGWRGEHLLIRFERDDADPAGAPNADDGELITSRALDHPLIGSVTVQLWHR